MRVDLKCRGLFSRKSALLEDDQLVILEHLLLSDRVRRVGFDRVEAVALSKRVPWVSLLILGLLVMGPGVVLLLVGSSPMPNDSRIVFFSIGGALLIAGSLVVLWHAVCRQSRIAVVRAGETRELRTITSPARVRRFVEQLRESVAQAQQPGYSSDAESEPAKSP